MQTFGLEGGNDEGVDVNVTALDFYYVPKLANPKTYLTFDPAVIHELFTKRIDTEKEEVEKTTQLNISSKLILKCLEENEAGDAEILVSAGCQARR